MDEFRLEPGTVLAEKYRLGSVLGTGGMGTVYQAEHLALRAQVAVKVIDREVDEGDVALARFMREAQSAASLRSPHVVQILDYGMEGKRPFMVMEMLEGEPLAARLKRLGRLTPTETYRVMSHVARAVSRAHEADIIHRDLKPDNVFLVHNEGDEIAKVLDFGVAKVESTQLDGEGHTRTGSLLGTPYYMSPEQAQGNKDIDARSDLWALGVIAFECLTGKRPFSSDGLGDLVLQICIRDIPLPSAVVPVPKGFDDWFLKACAREPDQRFQSARVLSESLREALDLGSDPGVSVPESRWASAASAPQEPLLSSAPTLDSAATRKDADAVPTPKSQRQSPERADDEADTEESPATFGPNDSQWEVVPHGSREAPSEAELTTESESPKEHSTGGSIVFVAIIALLLGGAVVFGIRQAGIGVFGDSSEPAASPPPRPLGPKDATDANASSPSPQVAADGSATNPTPNGEGANEEEQLDPDAEPGDETGDEDASSEDETADESGEEDLLDAIETEAEKALKDREESEGQEDRETKEKGVQSKPREEDDGSGPQPKLPDGLSPAPAPPPPPK